jgi:hypothetical protein
LTEFTVSAKKGKFFVTGKDREDDVAFRISGTQWDGEALRFASFYPPTKHKARNVLRVLPRGRMSWDITTTFDDDPCSEREVWRKVRSQSKHGKTKPT